MGETETQAVPEPPAPDGGPPSPPPTSRSGRWERASFLRRLLRKIKGPPRDPRDPGISHEITLIAFLAWVGLGSDGLSSSAYGPDESFRALVEHGDHAYLAIALALATGFTVLVISYAYSRIIEEFPHGGGGYVVATTLLGKTAGVVSGSALLVDYVLTIATSVASGAQLVVFFAPPGAKFLALPIGLVAVLFLTMINLRGVKESVTSLLPIFILFLATHAVLIVAGTFEHARDLSAVAREVSSGFARGRSEIGLWAMFLVFARAYSMGAGTYTGIEAVSNGIGIMREPKVRTAKRTMLYMALSLAITASGILLLYLLVKVRPIDADTPLNAILVENVAREWPLGKLFTILTVGSEVALLFVAAQTGFIDGPRVMASMATDGWLPRRFAALSDRLAMQNGILIIGLAAGLLLFYAEGSVVVLVTMYAINVFITFLLSNAGMLRLCVGHAYRALPHWRRYAAAHALAIALCGAILTVTVIEKFTRGAWLTIVVTCSLVGLCALIRRHYRRVIARIAELDVPESSVSDGPSGPTAARPAPVAVLLVGGYRGVGVHTFHDIRRMFPDLYRRFVFVSVGVVDSNALKGTKEIKELEEHTRGELERYVKLATDAGLHAESRLALGADVVDAATTLCRSIAAETPGAHFFAGKLLFEREAWYDRILHNEIALAIQRRLQFAGIPMIVMPVRVPEKKT